MYGPGTNLAHGGSLIFHSECQMRYIAKCLALLISNGHRSLKPRVEKADDWHNMSQKEMRKMVWSQPSVKHSFYKNAFGEVHIQPVASCRLLVVDARTGPGRLCHPVNPLSRDARALWATARSEGCSTLVVARNSGVSGRRGSGVVGAVMHRAVQYVAVAVGVMAMAIGASGTVSSAAVAASNPLYIGARVQPASGEVVGVAEPVTVTFPQPIADRAAAEQTIRITSPDNMTGRFEWPDDNTLQWIPTGLWPAHSHVSMMVGGRPMDLQTGAAVVGTASISQHTFTVTRDGEVLRQMPASMGKPTRPTPVGSFTVLEKDRSVIMDSRTIGIPLSSPEGYRITAYYAERITNGGVYVHSAPWSVDSQGHANVSHGCINLSPDNAAWYFDIVNVGDPVIVQE
jgi:lipoprotein-anchoring transpeptidase ErfK/SrfK